jgi:Thiamine pyrophosphate enzyme, C-terminal TPP binding domain
MTASPWPCPAWCRASSICYPGTGRIMSMLRPVDRSYKCCDSCGSGAVGTGSSPRSGLHCVPGQRTVQGQLQDCRCASRHLGPSSCYLYIHRNTRTGTFGAVAQVWFAREYPCYAPNSLLLDNALATMGAGVPSALAAKLVKPEVRVAAVLLFAVARLHSCAKRHLVQHSPLVQHVQANVYCIVGDGECLGLPATGDDCACLLQPSEVPQPCCRRLPDERCTGAARCHRARPPHHHHGPQYACALSSSTAAQAVTAS